jgi:transposase
MTIPGVGPITSHAFVLTIGDPNRFRSGRDVAAYLGLTPVVDSSAHRLRLGAISRAGDTNVRRLLTLGASSHLRQVSARPERQTPWVSGILGRRPVKVATIAQAAKTARIAWAVLKSGKPYDGEHAGRYAAERAEQVKLARQARSAKAAKKATKTMGTAALEAAA